MGYLTYVWLLLGATLLLSYFVQKYLTERYNIPSVALFIVLGVLLGSSGTGSYTQAIHTDLGFISDLVLGIISLMIGVELSPPIIKKLGKSIFFIAIGEVVVSALLVTWATWEFAHIPLYLALMLGAVACATAPAATVFVIQTYKSKGPLTSTLLGVVGVDDAFSLILFSIANVFATGLIVGSTSVSMMTILSTAAVEIGLSILFGIFAGIVFAFVAKAMDREESLLILIFSFILIMTGIAKYFHISQLLLIMTFGIVSVSINDKVTNKAKGQIEQTYNLLVPIFFILAGSTFNWKYALATLGIGIIYTLSRAIGKYLGAWGGATLSGLDQRMSRMVGLGLFPQVGVAFGLMMIVDQTFGSGQFGVAGKEMALIISNILIWTTFLTETIGPVLTRMALQKLGEINKTTNK